MPVEEPVKCWILRVRSANDRVYTLPIATRQDWAAVAHNLIERQGVRVAPGAEIVAEEIDAASFLEMTL